MNMCVELSKRTLLIHTYIYIYIYIYILYVYVIAWVAVKFGINTTSVVLEMGQISRGKAE